MDLTIAHLDLLRAVDHLEEPDKHPSTARVGARLLETLKARGGPYAWQAHPPWHGTDPEARQLEDGGLLQVHYGIAKYRRWDEPVEPQHEYWLGLTDAGREALRVADHP